ncbi:MAG: C39 family peptidase [bacterium]|nr:C39 family peptidase [bacterium]
MKKISIVCSLALILLAGLFVGEKYLDRQSDLPTYEPTSTASDSPTSAPLTSGLASPELRTIPTAKVIPMRIHTFQTFNNCGPASLSMALSYHSISKSQAELGQALRPYQVKSGDNDDKSTTLDELAGKAQEFGLLAYHRPNGNPEILKQFIAHDMPVITVTWLKPDDDIGHYRVMRGYDDNQNVFIQDDSYQGKNLAYTYDAFNVIWQKFNYEYLVLVPQEKRALAEEILGSDLDERISWSHAVSLSQAQLEKNPDDVDARFNLSVALHHTGDYQASIIEFEKVQNKLSFRTLWYQIEPLHSYYELGQYDKVFSISDSILNKNNRAFSELYILRGKIYLKQGKIDLARIELEKAVVYNENLKEAHDLLNSI